MSNKNYSGLVKSLIKSEEDINDIFYKDVPIGALFSRLFFYISKNDYRLPISRRIDIPVRVTFKSIKNFYFNRISFDRSVIATKISNRPNYAKLIDPIVHEYKDDALLLTSTPQNHPNTQFFNKLPSAGILSCLSILFFSIAKYSRICRILDRNNITYSKRSVFNTLYSQILSLHSSLGLVKKGNVKLVITDYDRNAYVNPIILAAKKYGIHTVTLVHGAIYPPYGYNPLIADEIWCWSKFQKQLLLEMGIDEKNIKITGNPITEVASVPTSHSLQIKNELDIHPEVFVIGLALNPIGKANNMMIIQLVLDAVQALKDRKIVILLKLHPFMKEKDLVKEDLDPDLIKIFEHKKYPNESFFSICDLLLTRGSSIGYEAILNNVLVGIIDTDKADSNRGNLDVMIKECHCPPFIDSSELEIFLQNIMQGGSGLREEILLKQRHFVTNEYYAAVGKEATRNMLDNINIILNLNKKGAKNEFSVT